jgi:hypothetical protein
MCQQHEKLPPKSWIGLSEEDEENFLKGITASDQKNIACLTALEWSFHQSTQSARFTH